MSAPLRLGSEDLRALADALDEFTAVFANHGVSITPYGGEQIQIGDVSLAVSWDAGIEQYIIDDRSGS